MGVKTGKVAQTLQGMKGGGTGLEFRSGDTRGHDLG